METTVGCTASSMTCARECLGTGLTSAIRQSGARQGRTLRVDRDGRGETRQGPARPDQPEKARRQ